MGQANGLGNANLVVDRLSGSGRSRYASPASIAEESAGHHAEQDEAGGFGDRRRVHTMARAAFARPSRVVVVTRSNLVGPTAGEGDDSTAAAGAAAVRVSRAATVAALYI